MIYYNQSLNIWSDNLSAVPRQVAALRAKFRAWDARGFPAEGWVAVTESMPVYDQSPLTGDRIRTLDASGNTYSWTVEGVHWSACIDDLAAARNRCRSVIDAATLGQQTATIEYAIPPGGKLDGVAAADTVVNLHMVHPEVATYWVDFIARFVARGLYAREEFDSVEGRVEIAGTDLAAVFALVAEVGSQRRVAWRRVERAFAAASTVVEYDAITAALRGK